MWLWLLLVLVTLLIIKLVNLHFYWSKHGIPFEPYHRYLYRLFWRLNTQPVCDVVLADVEKYGKIYGSYRGLRPSLVAADVEVAKEVLIKQFGNFFKRTFEFATGDPLWDNLLTHLKYDTWKAVRTIMGNSFTSSKMRGMIPKLDRVATRVVDRLSTIAKSSKNEIELNKFLKGYGMDSIVAISFGMDLDCIANPNNDFVKHASDLFNGKIVGLFMLLAPNLIKYLPFINFPPKETSKFFGELGKHVLEEKRKNLDEVIKNNSADIIDLHLIAQREDTNTQMSDEILASQTFLFFIGGLDTTVLTLEMTTYYLTVNPDVQQRAYEEITSIMGNRTEPTYEDLHKMKFLEATLLETLRILPSSFFFDRVCTQDTEVAGIPIKKGMVIEFATQAMHADPTYFPEPNKFLPQRFLKGDEISSETAAFLTFGDGPKNCIGRRLAIMNMQMALAKLLLKIRLESCKATPIPFRVKNGLQFTNISKDPIVIKLVPRE